MANRLVVPLLLAALLLAVVAFALALMLVIGG